VVGHYVSFPDNKAYVFWGLPCPDKTDKPRDAVGPLAYTCEMASSLSLSHVSNVTLISVYVVNGYVSRRSAVTDKSDIISAIVVALKPMCFVGIVGVDMPDNR